jgi:hypothetical protein
VLGILSFVLIRDYSYYQWPSIKSRINDAVDAKQNYYIAVLKSKNSQEDPWTREDGLAVIGNGEIEFIGLLSNRRWPLEPQSVPRFLVWKTLSLSNSGSSQILTLRLARSIAFPIIVRLKTQK